MLCGMGSGHVAVLDLSAEAIAWSQAAMGSEADRVDWIVADVTTWKPGRRYDVWPDRAAFDFLTDKADRAAYVETLDAAPADAGHAIIATFALDRRNVAAGCQCSATALNPCQTLGPRFRLVNGVRHVALGVWWMARSSPPGILKPDDASVVATGWKSRAA